jgi:hypothetical protein
MVHKANHSLIVLLAGAIVLLAAESGADARSFSVASSPHPQIGNATSLAMASVRSPDDRARAGWGYGRGWCHWHPYACYRNSSAGGGN